MNTFFRFSMIVLLILSLCSCTTKSIPESASENIPDDQIAQKVLLEFLDDLYSGKYDQATWLYVGSYENMQSNNPDLDPSAHAVLMWRACTSNGVQCLRVKSAVLDQKKSETEFVFKVEFLTKDDSLYVLGPCCGSNATDNPPRSDFYLKVVKTNEGKFVVMDMPPYQP